VVEDPAVIQALFLGLAAVLVASGILVVLQKNPVASALWLVLAFCSLAAIYLMLQAEFVGMVQIIVYAGAIMVLFLFVIMYLNLQKDVETGIQIAIRRGLGWILGAVLVVEGVLLVRRQLLPAPAPAPMTLEPVVGNTQAIGRLLYSRYLFPFEITSLVLLVAMIGVIVIAKGRNRPVGGDREAS
jgi:NADH-quinone oxidoreductase subunit J